MLRTTNRGTHRAEGPAVINYRELLTPISKGATGAAAFTAVAATAATGFQIAAADAAVTPALKNPTVRSQAPALQGVPEIAALGNITLRSGDRGAAVSALQQFLNAHGASLTVDGEFGPNTRDAVMAFQSTSGIGVDGLVGPATRNALANGATVSAPAATPAAPAASAAASSDQPTLRQGSRGDAVSNLQNLLNAKGASLGVDGDFGSGTRAAVVAFQASKGLEADGIVGARTWAALNSDGGSAAAAATPAVATTTYNAVSTSSSKSDASDAAIIATAEKYYDTPYVWGGTTPSGWDCSGFTSWVYRENGISIPRIAKDQAFAGRIVSKSEARPGDLVVFTSGDYGHIGIYAGDGKIIDAGSTPHRVTKRNIWTSAVIYVTYR